MIKVTINEVSQNAVNSASKSFERKNALREVFGDDPSVTRIVLNNPSGPLQQIDNELRKMGYFSINWEDRTISEKIKTEHGPKYRTMKLGAVIQKKLSPELYKEYHRFVSYDTIKNNSKVTQIFAPEQKFVFILSRHPIDILKMSDDKSFGQDFHSCHSESRTQFINVIQEASSGGAIAYAVAREQLYTFMNQNGDLEQHDEIFRDVCRGIGGAIPSARIRIRETIISSESVTKSIATVDSLYGKRIDGFETCVNDFVASKYAEAFNIFETQPDEVMPLGGTYDDSLGISNLYWSFLKKYNKNLENMHDGEAKKQIEDFLSLGTKDIHSNHHVTNSTHQYISSLIDDRWENEKYSLKFFTFNHFSSIYTEPICDLIGHDYSDIVESFLDNCEYRNETLQPIEDGGSYIEGDGEVSIYPATYTVDIIYDDETILTDVPVLTIVYTAHMNYETYSITEQKDLPEIDDSKVRELARAFVSWANQNGHSGLKPVQDPKLDIGKLADLSIDEVLGESSKIVHKFRQYLKE